LQQPDCVGVLGVVVFADLAYLVAEYPHESVVLVVVGAPVGEFALRFDFQRDGVALGEGVLDDHGQPVFRLAMRANSLAISSLLYDPAGGESSGC
jgi:hypothetical protein